MAVKINLEKDGIQKNGFIGFSWTTFFFGFLVPLCRGDVKWFFLMLVISIMTFGVGQIILCFFYNKFYTRELIEKGYQPTDDFSATRLKEIGIMREPKKS